jgi:adhesin transport system outer membrane protein
MNLKVLMVPALCLGLSTLSAATLKEVVGDVLETNPVIKERLKNYNATREEINIADAGYYPTLDLQSAAGKKYTNRFNGGAEETYDVFQNSLILRQNIFNGFSTHEQVNYQKMRTLAAAFSYLEKANDVTLQTIKVYLDLLRQKELLRNSKLNVEHNTKIYEKVSKAYKAGLTTLSEVSKVQSSLSLAKSNMMVQQNRLQNAMFNFRRVTGHMLTLKNLTKPNFSLKLPKSQEQATMYALEYNPSLLVGKYNIKGAEALYRESKSRFMPSVDLELSENYNKNYDVLADNRHDDRMQAMVVVSYNLFNGGADEAARRSKLSKLSQEVEVVNDLRRQVVEGIDLSWSAYELAKEQIPFLRDYQKQSMETLKLYSKEYEMGERSLLDLLATENDLKRANDELINARFNLLFSKYRILDAMGLTVASIMGNVEKYYNKVGIHGTEGMSGRDTLPVSLDADNDGVVASKDICAQSRKSGKKMPFGCTKGYQSLRSVKLGR